MDHARLHRIISGESPAPVDRTARLGLGALTPAYRLAVTGRNRLFDLGLRRPTRLGRPTISVGNLTTGGTGKTPMAIHLAQRLIDLGASPAILTRGYHGGDEARQMQAELPNVPVQIDPDRAAGAAAVLRAHPNTTAFILDDGFQHRRVHRDLDLVLIDATNPFGYGRLLPRGLLREPIGSLRRADAVIVTRCDQAPPAALAQLDSRIVAVAGRPPVAHAAMRWTSLRIGDEQVPIDALRPRRVLGVCGIGNPAAFERMLRDVADHVVGVLAFPDHHRYTTDDRARIAAAAKADDAEAVVMTEKDWVKWSALPTPDDHANADGPPIYRPLLSIDFLDGGDELGTLLRQALAPSTQ